jgi:hypothetical protein
MPLMKKSAGRAARPVITMRARKGRSDQSRPRGAHQQGQQQRAHREAARIHGHGDPVGGRARQAEQAPGGQPAQAGACRADHRGHRERPVLRAVPGYVCDEREQGAVEQLLAGRGQHCGHGYGRHAPGGDVGNRSQGLEQLGADHDPPGSGPVFHDRATGRNSPDPALSAPSAASNAVRLLTIALLCPAGARCARRPA